MRKINFKKITSILLLSTMIVNPIIPSKSAYAATTKYKKVGTKCYISDNKRIIKVVANGSTLYNNRKKPKKKLFFKIKAGKYKIQYVNTKGIKHTIIFWGDNENPEVKCTHSDNIVNVSVTDDTKLSKVLLNNKKTTSNFTISTPGNYTIVAVDKVGNKTTKTLTLKEPDPTPSPQPTNPLVTLVPTTKTPTTSTPIKESSKPVETDISESTETENAKPIKTESPKPIETESPKPTEAPSQDQPKTEITHNTITISGFPQGAKVVIKDSNDTIISDETTTASTYSKDIKVGYYTVTITKDGYNNYQKMFEISSAQSTTLNVSLKEIAPQFINATAIKFNKLQLEFSKAVPKTKHVLIDNVEISSDNITTDPTNDHILLITLPMKERIKNYDTKREVLVHWNLENGTTTDLKKELTISGGILPNVPDPKGNVIYEGTYKNTHWYIYSNGLLYITGTGDMYETDIKSDGSDYTQTPWEKHHSLITSARVEVTGATHLNCMFENLSNLKYADLNGLDTSKVTNMSRTFESCSQLLELDLSGFDTSNVTTMLRMFFCCGDLARLDCANWDTHNVTIMASMLKHVPVSLN